MPCLLDSRTLGNLWRCDSSVDDGGRSVFFASDIYVTRCTFLSFFFIAISTSCCRPALESTSLVLSAL